MTPLTDGTERIGVLPVDDHAIVRGLGLRGMRERVARLGGRLAIESAPGLGTRVRLEVAR